MVWGFCLEKVKENRLKRDVLSTLWLSIFKLDQNSEKRKSLLTLRPISPLAAADPRWPPVFPPPVCKYFLWDFRFEVNSEIEQNRKFWSGNSWFELKMFFEKIFCLYSPHLSHTKSGSPFLAAPPHQAGAQRCSREPSSRQSWGSWMLPVVRHSKPS